MNTRTSTTIPSSGSNTLSQPYGYQYYKEVFAGQRMPFAYIDLDLLEQNIRQIATNASDKRVRIASKSIRSVAILKRILAADARFQGIMCFTAQEAAYLASLGFADLLIGYPTWQDIDVVARAIAKGAQITLMIDSIEQIKQIEQVAQQYEVTIPVCLDLDMALDLPGLHFGVWRSPLRTTAQMRPIIELIIASPHVQFDGIMGYEAQIAGLGDHYKGQAAKNRLVRTFKKRSQREVARRRAETIDLVNSYDLPLRFVNGGGTGSLHTTREEPGVTEITAGSGFYAPALFDHYRDFRYQPAAGFAIEIVRQARSSNPPIYTCLGGGYVASGTAQPDRLPQVHLPHGAQLVSLEGAGEVQTPIIYPGPLALKPGDPIFLRHSKAGELCERFTHLLLVSNGKIVDTVTTYRGDGQCFL
ncbi:MAG TPA: amino acid deaminase/aldolase [Ktedonobacteraceae bacterium]|nr:amino acid deaminase/aldolase [Ktedonobacteraceae bacterium]